MADIFVTVDLHHFILDYNAEVKCVLRNKEKTNTYKHNYILSIINTNTEVICIIYTQNKVEEIIIWSPADFVSFPTKKKKGL